jgi:hypothetical protein
MSVDAQVHSKFKLFSGTLDKGAISRELATEVEEFARNAKAAPKSIGVEYLEHERRVILSLGYRDDEPAYPIRLESASLGVGFARKSRRARRRRAGATGQSDGRGGGKAL